MYSWDYIEEATLAKLDLDQDSGVEANKIGYIDRFLIYANEAMTQICNSIKPKRTSVEITVYDANDPCKPINAKYITYTDISLNNVIKNNKNLYSSPLEVSNVSMNNENVVVYLTDGTNYIIGKSNSTIEKYELMCYEHGVSKYIVIMEDNTSFYFSVILTEGGTTLLSKGTSDFVAFSNSPSYEKIIYKDYFGKEETKLVELHNDILLYHGYNNVMFLKPGNYIISYKARWFTFTTELTNDDKRGEPLDAPDDVLDCIPSYIASQCYKVDDEYKAQVYRNEYEMFLARVDDTDFDGTTTFEIGGDW